jgi:hypothetical protein
LHNHLENATHQLKFFWFFDTSPAVLNNDVELVKWMALNLKTEDFIKLLNQANGEGNGDRISKGLPSRDRLSSHSNIKVSREPCRLFL